MHSFEKRLIQIQQKVLDSSFEETVKVAMLDLNYKVDLLNSLIESQRDDIDYDYKVNI